MTTTHTSRQLHEDGVKLYVRYNLSTNECFIKKGRAPSGRGFYWAIHPACVEDFDKGEFNRRLARQRQYATRVGTSIHQVGLQELIIL